MKTLLITVTACGLLLGCAGTPTKFEQSIFDIKTNQVPVLVVHTNTIWTTNTIVETVTRTNEVGVPVPILVTNYVSIPQLVPVLVTNYVPVYDFQRGTNAAQIQDAAGAVGGLLGAGPIASGAAGILLGIWGWLRSTNKSKLAVNMSQSIETIREFVKTLPNGAQYDTAITQWMQANQAKADVLQQVVKLIQDKVSNDQAKLAAKDIADALEALKPKA